MKPKYAEGEWKEQSSMRGWAQIIPSGKIILTWDHSPRSVAAFSSIWTTDALLFHFPPIFPKAAAVRLVRASLIASFPLHGFSCTDRLMRWGYILCSTALLRGIRLVGHGDITYCRHREAHCSQLTLNLLSVCGNKHTGEVLLTFYLPWDWAVGKCGVCAQPTLHCGWRKLPQLFFLFPLLHSY